MIASDMNVAETCRPPNHRPCNPWTAFFAESMVLNFRYISPCFHGEVDTPVVEKYADLTVLLNLDSIDLAILILTFTFDIVSKILIPITLCFSAKMSVGCDHGINRIIANSSGSNIFLSKTERDCMA